MYIFYIDCKKKLSSCAVMPIEWSIFQISYINVFFDVPKVTERIVKETTKQASFFFFRKTELDTCKEIKGKMYKVLTVFVLVCSAIGYSEVNKQIFFFISTEITILSLFFSLWAAVKVWKILKNWWGIVLLKKALRKKISKFLWHAKYLKQGLELVSPHVYLKLSAL